MARRNEHFHSRAPFRGEKLNLKRADGPFAFLNPTRAHFVHEQLSSSDFRVGDSDAPVTASPTASQSQDAELQGRNVHFLWRSRDNRKGRHTLIVRAPAVGDHGRIVTPRQTAHPREILTGIWRTFTCYPVWDISWVVAFIFTWGSVVWVINGFFAWLPLEAPSTEFPNEILYGGGITAFIGAILFFEVGSILLLFEAVNANNAGCFGWAIEQLLENDKAGSSMFQIRASRQHCRHHHQNRRNFVGKGASSVASEAKFPGEPSERGRSWQWFPSLHDLRAHYLHELGFLAGVAQLFGATIFGISGFTALPGINNHLTPQSALNGAYWIPQVIGGSGFIVSSTLYMLETQVKWYLPAFNVLGWHIAFWNLIGALGFTLCGALGMAYGNSGAQYQASLATFWGSWAFLTGSYLQLYESLDKHVVEQVSPEKYAEIK